MRRATKLGGRVAVVHWRVSQGAPIFTILFQVLAAEYGNPALLSEGLGLLSADELSSATNDAGIEDVRTCFVEVDSVMPEPDEAVSELHPLFEVFPIYRDLDSRALLRVQSEYAQRVREVGAEGRTDADRARAHIAIGRKT